MSRVTTVLNEFHNSFAIPSDAHTGLSMTSGNCPKSPTNIITFHQKEYEQFLGRLGEVLNRF